MYCPQSGKTCQLTGCTELYKACQPNQPLTDNNAQSASEEIPEDKKSTEIPKHIRGYLDLKQRPFHNKVSFRAGAIELWEYLLNHELADLESYKLTIDIQQEEIHHKDLSILQRDKDYLKVYDQWQEREKEVADYRKALEEIRKIGNWLDDDMHIAAKVLAKYPSTT